MEQVKELYAFDLGNHKSLERVRDLFVFGCTTGMRYGNYSKMSISKRFSKKQDLMRKSRKQ